MKSRWRGDVPCELADRGRSGRAAELTVEKPAERGKRDRADLSESAEEDWNGEGEGAQG